jgi:hypothetical protein
VVALSNKTINGILFTIDHRLTFLEPRRIRPTFLLSYFHFLVREQVTLPGNYPEVPVTCR